MKNIINIKYSLIISVCILLAATGCHQTNNSNPTALVGLHMHTFIDTNLVDPAYSNVYFTDANGRNEVLTMAQMYVTNVSFRNKSTQQWYTIPNSIMLKRIQNEEYSIGTIPAGTYDAVAFTVGLNNTLNSQPPSYYSSAGLPAADSVLSPTEQSVMWLSAMNGMNGMASGYTFLNVQGYDSTDHVAFSYQLGGYGDTVRITMPYTAGFTLAPNEPQVVQYIHIIADYGKLLQNINLRTAPNGSFYSTTPANVTNSTNVWTNIINMFRYECPTPNGTC